MNLLNVFKKNQEVNEKNVTLLVLTLLPIMFVTTSLAATIIYLLAYIVFIILATLLTKLFIKLDNQGIKWILMVISFVGISTFIAQLISAMYILFAADFIFYIYLMPITALPYVLAHENHEDGVGKSLVNALQSLIAIVVLLVVTAFLRELLGTGGISFTKYLNSSFSFSVISKYASTTLMSPFSSLIITGLIIAIYQAIVNSKQVKGDN